MSMVWEVRRIVEKHKGQRWILVYMELLRSKEPTTVTTFRTNFWSNSRIVYLYLILWEKISSIGKKELTFYYWIFFVSMKSTVRWSFWSIQLDIDRTSFLHISSENIISKRSINIELRLWRLAITNHTLSGVFPVCDIVIIVAISLGPGPAAPVAKKRFSPKVRVESPGRLARSPIASPQNSGTWQGSWKQDRHEHWSHVWKKFNVGLSNVFLTQTGVSVFVWRCWSLLVT